MQNPDRKILVLWVIAIALITKDELSSGQTMPRPFRYVGSAMVYGIAAVVSEFAGDLAVWLAVGWTLSIAYKSLSGSKGATGKAVITGARSVRPAVTSKGKG